MIMPFITEDPKYKCEFTVGSIEKVSLSSSLNSAFRRIQK